MSTIAAPRSRRAELLRFIGYADLLTALLRRELRAKYKGSALGVLWSYVYPLVMMGVYTLVFSVLWRAVDIPNYPLFVLTGLALWSFFQGALQSACPSLVTNGELIKKVWFPREVIPLAVVLGQLATAAVMFAVIVPVNVVVVPETARTVALALPIFAALVCLTLGLAWLVAAAHVFFRDVEHLLNVLLLPWFFLTPILYGLEQLPGAAGRPLVIDLLRYGNPITPYVESIRGVMLEATVPGPGMLAYVFIAAPVVFVLGLWVFQRCDDRIAVEL